MISSYCVNISWGNGRRCRVEVGRYGRRDRRIGRRSSVEKRRDRCVTMRGGQRRGTGRSRKRTEGRSGKGRGSGREVKERESGQRLGNNRTRRKIHENLFLISWPIAVYIYAQYGRARVILSAIWSDRGDSSAFIARQNVTRLDRCLFRYGDATSCDLETR